MLASLVSPIYKIIDCLVLALTHQILMPWVGRAAISLAMNDIPKNQVRLQTLTKQPHK